MRTKKPASPLVPPAFVRQYYAEILPVSEVLALEVLFALRSGAQAIDKLVSRWLGDDALTPGRWQVLMVLWSSDHPVPQRAIVSALRVSRANVSALLETLQREGHVMARPDPDDGRKMLMCLTEAGRATTERLMRDTAGKLRRNLALDDGELRLLARLLSQVLH